MDKYEIEYQVWLAPSVEDENKDIHWSMRNKNHVLVTKNHDIILDLHTHTECGIHIASGAVCAHADDLTHTTDELFMYVESIADINKNISKKYFVLFDDIVATESINVNQGGITYDIVLCLGGHKLTMNERLANRELTNNQIFTICNCKETGHITTGRDDLDHAIYVRQGSCYLYNVDLKDINMTQFILLNNNTNTAHSPYIENMNCENFNGTLISENTTSNGIGKVFIGNSTFSNINQIFKGVTLSRGGNVVLENLNVNNIKENLIYQYTDAASTNKRRFELYNVNVNGGSINNDLIRIRYSDVIIDEGSIKNVIAATNSGIYVDESSLTIDNVNFASNDIGKNLIVSANTKLKINGSKFDNNTIGEELIKQVDGRMDLNLLEINDNEIVNNTIRGHVYCFYKNDGEIVNNEIRGNTVNKNILNILNSNINMNFAKMTNNTVLSGLVVATGSMLTMNEFMASNNIVSYDGVWSTGCTTKMASVSFINNTLRNVLYDDNVNTVSFYNNIRVLNNTIDSGITLNGLGNPEFAMGNITIENNNHKKALMTLDYLEYIDIDDLNIVNNRKDEDTLNQGSALNISRIAEMRIGRLNVNRNYCSTSVNRDKGLININDSIVTIANEVGMYDNEVGSGGMINIGKNASLNIPEGLNMEDNTIKSSEEALAINMLDPTSVMTVLGTLSITNNIMREGGAVRFNGGTMNVGGYVYVDRNATIRATIPIRNIVIASVNSLIKAVDSANKIRQGSSIKFTSLINEEVKIFETWSDEYIDNFRGEPHYFTDNVFKVDTETKQNGKQIYKKGEIGETALYIGKNYQELVFVLNGVNIATQYVATKENTYVDVIYVDDVINRADQNWIAPRLDNEFEFTTWHMDIDDYAVNISTTSYAYISTHSHAICGIDIDEENCNHAIEVVHTENVKYLPIYDANVITNRNYPYFSLARDIEIDKTLIPKKSTISICLAGHSIKIKKGMNLIEVKNNMSLTICDCKEHGNNGKITSSDTTTVNTPSKNSFIEISSGTIQIYGVTFDGLVDNEKTIINVDRTVEPSSNRSIYIEDSTFNKNNVNTIISGGDSEIVMKNPIFRENVSWSYLLYIDEDITNLIDPQFIKNQSTGELICSRPTASDGLLTMTNPLFRENIAQRAIISIRDVEFNSNNLVFNGDETKTDHLVSAASYNGNPFIVTDGDIIFNNVKAGRLPHGSGAVMYYQGSQNNLIFNGIKATGCEADTIFYWFIEDDVPGSDIDINIDIQKSTISYTGVVIRGIKSSVNIHNFVAVNNTSEKTLIEVSHCPDMYIDNLTVHSNQLNTKGVSIRDSNVHVENLMYINSNSAKDG